jgi:HD-GYP domain-containing protein (c-di-GMP phosphodiesterase class II)
MENKIFESLKKMLPENEVKEVSSVISEMIENAKDEMEKEYNKNLEEAYAQLSGELASAEKTAYEGYQEAYEIINDLRTRLEVQNQEFDAQLEEGYEEAYQMLLAERNSKSQVEVDLYEEYDQKLAEMKAYIVEKVDQFLQYKGSEIYEQAKKDLVNDPRILEHKVALDKIVNITSDYLSDEDKSFATASKIEEASKAIEELRGQLRIMEARNIRLSTDNTRLTESVRRVSHNVITEAAKPAAAAAKKTKVLTEQKERTMKVKNASGRGHVDTENVQVIAEFNDNSNGAVNDLLVLSGVKKSKN